MKYTREFFQPKYKHHINQDISFYPFDDLIDGKYNLTVDLNVFLPTYGTDLQRGLVWTQTQKEQLILSLLRGATISKFVIVQHKTGTSDKFSKIKVIDGKQRITTIFSFIKNEFPIVIDGTKVYYKDLHPYCQSDINKPNGCRWDIHYSYEDSPIADDVLVQIFEQVNFLGTPQDVDHLENIKKLKK
jgi:hypothetical protein